ncbi:MAG: hypothetical protein AAGL68_02655 [Pseudomonadota bacterium]
MYSVASHDYTLNHYLATILNDPWFWYQGLIAAITSFLIFTLLMRFFRGARIHICVCLAALSPIALIVAVFAILAAINGGGRAVVSHFVDPRGLISLSGWFAFGLFASLSAARFLPSRRKSDAARTFE